MRFASVAPSGVTMALTGAALLAAALLSSPAQARGKQNFELVNVTGYTISEVYVSPTKINDWEEDVMGRDVLPDGTAVDIVFDRSEDACIWDLKVVYDDGETAEWHEFDLCTISTIAISYDRKSGETWAEWE